MNDKDALKDVLASNVNTEVLVFRGATTGELMVLAGVSTAIVVPAALVLGVMSAKVPLFISLSLPVVFILIFVCSSFLLAIKRGRPDGYFAHRLLLLAHKLKLKPSSLVVEHGRLSSHRVKQIVVAESFMQTDDA